MSKSVPLGTGPFFAIMLFLFTLLYALLSAESLQQWFLQFAVTGVGLALIYFVWRAFARRNPTWRMGTSGQAEAVFLIIAVFLFLGASGIIGWINGLPGASSIGLSFTPLGGVADQNGVLTIILIILLAYCTYEVVRGYF